jgi:hypothetical protein
LPNQSEESLVLTPGDIQITITNHKPDGGFHLVSLDDEEMSPQSMRIGLTVSRKDINGLGSNYIKDRKIQFPLLGTISISFLARKFKNMDDIENIFKDDVDCDIELLLRARTGPGSRSDKLKISITNAKLDGESHSMSTQGFAQVEAQFVFEVTPEFGLSLMAL